MGKTTYKVTILNWEKHNPKHKRGMKKFMFYSGFFSDPKIAKLDKHGIALYLYTLCVACEQGSNTIRIDCDVLPKSLRIGDKLLTNTLERFESLQLVTLEKLSLIKDNIIKDKIIKDKLRKGTTEKKSEKDAPQPVAVAPAVENCGNVIAHYCDQWKTRYRTNVSPTIDPKDAKNLNRLVKSNGGKKIMAMIEAYFKMPDNWFLTKTHDIPTFINNLNKVTHFMETGKMITRNDIKTVESKMHTQNLLDMVDRGEI